jgi:hypothetical protein
MTFPLIIIALFTLAAIEQLFKGNVPLAVFYGLSGAINISVLFIK